ncbi:hypothetical protein, partial [Desulfosarcina cetonica]|uniref:hypothetical protein n=1 Tax=Desulfosarcina cetonica TaxID=90730 RepID=UPI001C476F94
NINTLESFNKYLEEYPSGNFVSQSRKIHKALAIERKQKEKKYNDESRICNSTHKLHCDDCCKKYDSVPNVKYYQRVQDGVYEYIESPPGIVCQYGAIYTNTGWRCSSLEECKSTSKPALFGGSARNIAIRRIRK